MSSEDDPRPYEGTPTAHDQLVEIREHLHALRSDVKKLTGILKADRMESIRALRAVVSFVDSTNVRWLNTMPGIDEVRSILDKYRDE